MGHRGSDVPNANNSSMPQVTAVHTAWESAALRLRRNPSKTIPAINASKSDLIETSAK